MSDLEDIGYNSDEEVNKKQHARLLDEVLLLDKRQHVKKPSRTEPTTHVSEFNLLKTNLGKKNRISLNDLTKSLDDKEKHVSITKKVKTAFKEKTLQKPLEKPQAERLRRSVGFSQTKGHLNKWNSIVEKNRVAAYLEFPLNQSEVHFESEMTREETKPRYQSELDKELAQLEPKVETIVVEEKFPLNMQELIEQRKEMARLRARQSYQEAKARKQHKIKSKKYHKVQRKMRLKQQIKEFEELQKVDPEAALRKLEQLEKTRAEERMTLRHRSTGQWAKNKQVRAKYDKESRQVLAQQLSLSRDLTQKIKRNDSSDSEDDEAIDVKTDESNPWTSQKSDEFSDFVSGYRKFWMDKNKINGQEHISKDGETNKKNLSVDGTEKTNSETVEGSSESKHNESQKNKKRTKNDKKVQKNNKSDKINSETEEESSENKHNESQKNTKKVKKSNKSKTFEHRNDSWTVVSTSDDENDTLEKSSKRKHNKNQTNSKKDKNCKKVKKIDKTKTVEHRNDSCTIVSTSDDENETIFDSKPVEDLFDDLQFNVKRKSSEKLSKLKKLSHKIEKSKKRKLSKSSVEEISPKKSDLMLKPEKMRPQVDEELGMDSDSSENDITSIEKRLNSTETIKPVEKTQNIDPNKYIIAKPTELNTKLPDMATFEDDSEDEGQKAYISEAFADDDVIDEFTKEKKDTIDANTPNDIDLSLPGWGSWGGKNIEVSKRKKRRFVLKIPKDLPRRDENKGNLILNEEKDTKIKKHQVSEVPFPFTSTKDFEASIRAPIGDTFLPQTAFRRLIRPAVKTKKGAIIEPMTDGFLLKQKFTRQGRMVTRK